MSALLELELAGLWATEFLTQHRYLRRICTTLVMSLYTKRPKHKYSIKQG